MCLYNLAKNIFVIVNLSTIQVSSLSGLTGPSLQRDAPGKERKKVKLKKPGTAPKPRTIKFHEYKVEQIK